MCITAFAWQQHPEYPLVLIANRDEFHNRPTAAAHWWAEDNSKRRILAGKDLQAGGTWLGLAVGPESTRRLTLLTNYRDPYNVDPNAQSRGELPLQFLQSDSTPAEFHELIQASEHRYNGFNLLMFDGQTLGYTSSEGGFVGELPPGFYALSNALLDTPWPKTTRLKAALAATLSDANLFEAETGFTLLRDTTRPHDSDLPQTGIPLDFERLLSAPFIISPAYGTRASYVITLNRNRVWAFHERSFNPAGDPLTDNPHTQSFTV